MPAPVAPAFLTEVAADAVLVRFVAPSLIDPIQVEEVGVALLALHELHAKVPVVIDFGVCNGVSSAMVGKLITLHRRIRRGGGKLVLFGLGPIVQEVFRSARLDEYFTLCRTRDEALAKARTPAPG